IRATRSMLLLWSPRTNPVPRPKLSRRVSKKLVQQRRINNPPLRRQWQPLSNAWRRSMLRRQVGCRRRIRPNRARAKRQNPNPGETTPTNPPAGAPRAAPARRAAKTVRARRIVATAAAQPAYQYGQSTYAQPTYSQPTYTWLDGTAQASHPVKRVQIKRHRV